MLGDREGVESGDGYADEIHQVVACESQCQGERPRQDRDAQDVDLEPLDEEQQHGACHPADEERQQQVPVDHSDEGIVRKQRFESFEDCEIDDRRKRCAAPHRPEAAKDHCIAKREDRTRNIHDDRTAGEGDDYRQQNRRDDTHGARGVDEMPERTDAQRGVVRDLVDRHGDGRAQQAEDQRDGGRGGQSPRVVEIQQDNVGEHHAQV